MKTVTRFLSLAALLVLGTGPNGSGLAAAGPPLQSRNDIKASVLRAVTQFAAENGYPLLVIEYDSDTDFRLYNAKSLFAYGYYDEEGGPDQRGEVFIYPI